MHLIVSMIAFSPKVNDMERSNLIWFKTKDKHIKNLKKKTPAVLCKTQNMGFLFSAKLTPCLNFTPLCLTASHLTSINLV